jgi:hypothetical protein
VFDAVRFRNTPCDARLWYFRSCKARATSVRLYMRTIAHARIMHRFFRVLACSIAAATVFQVRAQPCGRDEPCEYYQYCRSGLCIPCTPGTFGTPAQCRVYNASLPWNLAADSAFLHDELHALAARCEAHVALGGIFEHERAVQSNAERMCNASADGQLGRAPLVLAADKGPWALTPGSAAYRMRHCPRGSYADEAGHACVKCPRTTTTEAAGATSRLDCDACELGWRWDPEREMCAQCPRCYTTRAGAGAGADVTREETCTPCSVFADDYRRGGCSPFVAEQCVLFVPMADVHATMERRIHTQNTDEYNTHVATEYYNLNNENDLATFVRYVYNHSAVGEHALFRAQNYDRLLLNEDKKTAQEDWRQNMQAPRAYTGYAYTAGMMYYESVGRVWEIDEIPGKENVIPMFELSGAHVVPMHRVSTAAATHYDMVRAAYEAVLRGVIGSNKNAVGRGSGDMSILQYARAVGVVLDADLGGVYGAEQFATEVIADNDQRCTGEQPRNAPCLAIEYGCTVQNHICTSRGQYFGVWEKTELYLTNASAIFARIDAAIAAWERRIAGMQGGALGCDEERVRLAVNVTATQHGAAVTVEAIEVLGADGAVLLRHEMHRTVAPLHTGVEVVNVTVRTGSVVHVYVFTNDTKATAVTVQTRTGVAEATVRSMHHARAGFAVCEPGDAACCEKVARVATPLDYERLSTTLGSKLCRIG